jgi:hypothetical protein
MGLDGRKFESESASQLVLGYRARDASINKGYFEDSGSSPRLIERFDTDILMNMSHLRIQNILAKALGAFWLLDGLLQFQPQMFGQAFVTNILVPILDGQPGFVQALIQFGTMLWNTNTIWTNTTAALLQCAIGILLFFPLQSKRFKIGLWISIVWGLIVWVFGEGLGMLLTGSSNFYTGAPGAVLAYVVLAIFLLKTDKLSETFFARFAGWSLIVLALLQLQSTFWTSNGIQSVFMGSMDTLSFISAMPTYLGNIAAAHAISTNLLLLAIPILLGSLLIWKPNRIVAVTSLIFLFLVWWLGQDFGMLSTLITGVSTDPNMAPVFALFITPLIFQKK